MLVALESATRSQGAYVILATQLVDIATQLDKSVVAEIFSPAKFPHAMGKFVSIVRERGTEVLHEASRAALESLKLPLAGDFMTSQDFDAAAKEVANALRTAVEEVLKKLGGPAA